jgi:hypothetical protein
VEIVEAVEPHAAGDDAGALTETFWAALHGRVTLMRNRRLSGEHQKYRLELLLARFIGRR